MTKAETYKKLLNHCREELDWVSHDQSDYRDGTYYSDDTQFYVDLANRLQKQVDFWSDCVDLLESEESFHLKVLESRE